MGFLDRILGRRRAAIPVAPLRGALMAEASARIARPTPGPLALARLADLVRDAGGDPGPAAGWGAWEGTLNEEGWQRVSILVGAANVVPPIREFAAGGAGFVRATGELAAELPRHTRQLLVQAEVRAEELARRWISALGAEVEGESAAVSAATLTRLDYERLLLEADAGKASAEEQAKRLRAMREAEAAKRRPRGKF